MKEILEQLCGRNDLSTEACAKIFSRIIAGEVSEIELSALLVALKCKGETPEEIAGAAIALRKAAAKFDRPDYFFADTCGTGGDGAQTVNISTAVAFVCAQLGLPIAKHGNVSVSSKCGSADVLQQLGVCLKAPMHISRRCLDEAGLCFLFAPNYHSGLRHAMPIRKTLKIRTIFNLLGPLVNPSAPTWQVMGVYDPRWCEPMARTLGMLGCEGALVVHGSGLDEIAVHGQTQAAYLSKGKVEMIGFGPEDAGVDRFPIEALQGGTPEENAQWLKSLLSGDGSTAHNAAVAINAGALLWISGKAENLKEGTGKALDVLHKGEAIVKLEQLVELSNGA